MICLKGANWTFWQYVKQRKKKGEIMFGRVKGRMLGVMARRKRKQGVGILIKNKLWRCVKECKDLNSRLVWVRIILRCEK